MKFSKVALNKVILLICYIVGLYSNAQSIEHSKPNIVFILADDMGIGDAGCYGGNIIKTPNIDKLASTGKQFMHHYSGSTVCAPSRCSLITGKSTGNSRVRGNKGMKSALGTFDMPLKEEDITVASILQENGYTTMCVGKWGLGGPKTSGSPVNKGFDYFFGYLSQGAAHRYYPKYLYENEEKYYLNEEVYSHDLILEKGVEFIEKNADKPFFAYFAITPPHADLDVPTYNGYADSFDETPYINNKGKGYITQLKPKAAYASLVTEVDKTVGRVVETLKAEGVYENTIVIFSSDNGVHNVGGNDPTFFASNGGFRGIKRDLYEGGIRTPFIVSWQNHINPGKSTHVSTFWDFLPTVCDLIDVKAPKGIDGISYYEELMGEKKQKKHDYIYFEFHEQGGKQSILSVKDGWKLIRLKVNKKDKMYEELYNIYDDVSEQNNLLDKYPNIVRKLRMEMDKSHTTNENFKFNNEI